MKPLVIHKCYPEVTDEVIARMYASLPPRELIVIGARHRANPPMTLEEIGRLLCVSRERVRQIEVRAFYRMRDRLRKEQAKQDRETAAERARQQQWDALVRQPLPFDALPCVRRGIFTAPDIPVDDLEISVRTANCLRNAGCNTIGDILQISEANWLRTPNFGRKSLMELKEVLSYYGLHMVRV